MKIWNKGYTISERSLAYNLPWFPNNFPSLIFDLLKIYRINLDIVISLKPLDVILFKIVLIHLLAFYFFMENLF